MKRIAPFLYGVFFLICTFIFYGVSFHYKKKEPSCLPIRWIAQTGPIKEGLKNDYLAELLGLSKNHPKPIDPEEAQNILKRSPLIREVQVSVVNIDTLYIDYVMRQPRFFLLDFSNIAVDEVGCLMPFKPFFTPKRLPALFLGLKSMITWSEPIQKEKMHLALDLVHYLENIAHVSQIDLSQVDEETLGKREITVTLDNANKSRHYLRLSLKRYAQEISHYCAVRERIEGKSCVIDLRVANLAFIKDY